MDGMEGSKTKAAEKNSYVQLRESKIARNRERLQVLGLWSPPTDATPPTTDAAITADTVSSKKRRYGGTRPMEPVVIPTRRSLRHRGLQVNYAEQTLSDSTRNIHKISARIVSPLMIVDAEPRTTSTVITAAHLQSMNEIASTTLLRPVDSSKTIRLGTISARDVSINAHQLLFGSSPERGDGLLGKQMSKTGKAFVMEETVRLAAQQNDTVYQSSGCSISFNKYSGIQKWGGSNTVIFLWINFAVPQSDVVNEFCKEGRHVTWYGGSKMHNGTPAIRNLIRIALLSTTNSSSRGDDPARSATPTTKNNGDPAVVLWCRQHDKSRKAFGAYTCMGRLSVRSSLFRFECLYLMLQWSTFRRNLIGPIVVFLLIAGYVRSTVEPLGICLELD